MCGISCVGALRPNEQASGNNASADGNKAQLASELDNSLEYIRHRGPDQKGIWSSADHRVGLAHCRLAINDLRPSTSQPLHSADNAVHAVVNGEIYDSERLRQDLAERFQYYFQTRSDSEVVLALYQHYGNLAFLGHLRGEFALCIYGQRKKIFVAARDRYGIKALFWTKSKGRLLVAAEVKAFLGLGWEVEWDVQSLVER